MSCYCNRLGCLPSGRLWERDGEEPILRFGFHVLMVNAWRQLYRAGEFPKSPLADDIALTVVCALALPGYNEAAIADVDLDVLFLEPWKFESRGDGVISCVFM